MANEMPERIWLDADTYNGVVGFAHAKRKDQGEWQSFTRSDLCASGQVRPATIAHVIAEMMERAGEPRPNGDILADVLCQVLPAALTPAPQPDAEHCGCGDKACLACFPAATPTAQEAVPVALMLRDMEGVICAFTTKHTDPAGTSWTPLYAHPPQPSETVAEASRLIGEARLWLDTGFDLAGETLDYSPGSISQILDKLDAALRALKGGEA